MMPLLILIGGVLTFIAFGWLIIAILEFMDGID